MVETDDQEENGPSEEEFFDALDNLDSWAFLRIGRKSSDTMQEPAPREMSYNRWAEAAKEVVMQGTGIPESLQEKELEDSSILDDISQGKAELWDPEACIILLRTPSVTNYSGIRKLIEKASQEWMEEFIELDGLEIVFESLKRLSICRDGGLANAVLQLESMMCIKAVMNSETGLQYIILNSKYTRKLATVLASDNILVKKQVFELLSALCVYSEEGHTLAQDSLTYYKELRETDVIDYKASILAFINCLILNEDSLPTRMSFRNQILGLCFMSDIEGLLECENSQIQLQATIFKESYEDDCEIFYGKSNSSSVNPFEAFNSLYEKVRDTHHEFDLLLLLINLSNLTEKNEDSIWKDLEAISSQLNHVDASRKRITDARVKSMCDMCTQTVPPSTCPAGLGNACMAESFPLKEDSPLEDESTPDLSPVTCLETSKLKDYSIPDEGGKFSKNSDGISSSLIEGMDSPGSPPPPLPQGPPPSVSKESKILSIVEMPTVSESSFGPQKGTSIIPPPPPLPPLSGAFLPPPPPPPPPPPMFLGKAKDGILQAGFVAGVSSVPQFFHTLPKPKQKMKRLNWNKVQAGSLESSVWKEVNEDLDRRPSVSIDFSEIESLFSQKNFQTEGTSGRASFTVKQKHANIIDPKRSLNVNIFLKQFKMSPSEVVDLIYNCSSEELGAERLRNLFKLIPEEGEINAIRDSGIEFAKLGDAEKFFLELHKIPHYVTRLEAMLQGSYAGNAVGFQLRTLSKLWDTRSNRPGMTLIHYIVENAPEDILYFTDELVHIKEVSRMSMEYLIGELQGLRNGLDNLLKALTKSSEELQSKFTGHFKKFDSDLVELEKLKTNIEEYRTRLADYFCEERKKFKLEECFEIFCSLCLKIKSAKQENEDRRGREEKRKRMEEERQRREKEEPQKSKRSKRNIGSSSTDGPNEGCLIDLLLADIRQGNFKLRRS